ncbi:sugar kinase [Amycolatopsis alkalitolerans]|uniref:Sugar kinase n=1 Tax=Amycolatopsis alkalitolerans TaxID=2547244 RepID=A0A5C4LT98_9PSEU|nr:sugar kinase [Amycolatopsis alkalitolerans]
MDLLAIGETMVMVTPRPGGRLDAHSSFLLRPGGAESNVAALLSALGHRTAWAGAVGNDPLGDIVVNSLRERGVEVGLVRRDAERPTAVYFKDPGPEGTKVYYYRSGSAAAAMSTADLAAWTGCPARVVHLTGITAAISPQGRELTHHLLAGRPLGTALASFDVNHRPALWSAADAAPVLLDLAQRSDIVFVGRDEAETLWGTPDAGSVRKLIDRPGHLIVKDAAVEAVGFTPDGECRVPATPVEVVDAVGAGDAFAAGWLSGLLDGRDETTRLRLGHFAASRVLRSPSDLAELPRAAEVVAGFTAGPATVPGGSRATERESDRPCRKP